MLLLFSKKIVSWLREFNKYHSVILLDTMPEFSFACRIKSRVVDDVVSLSVWSEQLGGERLVGVQRVVRARRAATPAAVQAEFRQPLHHGPPPALRRTGPARVHAGLPVAALLTLGGWLRLEHGNVQKYKCTTCALAVALLKGEISQCFDFDSITGVLHQTNRCNWELMRERWGGGCNNIKI